jgi:hypothetical protein
VCVDFGSNNIAHVEYSYPPDAEQWVKDIAQNNERWATLIGYTTFVLVFVINNKIFKRMCEENDFVN